LVITLIIIYIMKTRTESFWNLHRNTPEFDDYLEKYVIQKNKRFIKDEKVKLNRDQIEDYQIEVFSARNNFNKNNANEDPDAVDNYNQYKLNLGEFTKEKLANKPISTIYDDLITQK